MLDPQYLALIWHAALSAASFAVSRAGTLVTSVLAARLLGVSRYGHFGLIQTTISTVQVFVGGGLGLTTTCQVAVATTKSQERTSAVVRLALFSTLMFALLGAVAVVVFASPLAVFIGGNEESVHGLRIGAPLLVASLVSVVASAALMGLGLFSANVAASVVGFILGVPVFVGLTYFFGLEGALIGAAVILAIQAVASVWSLRKTIWARAVTDKTDYAAFFKMVIPTTVSGFFLLPANWVGMTIVARSLDGFAQVAVVSAASQWRNLALALPSFVGQACLPAMSRRVGEGSPDNGRILVLLNLAMSVGLTTLVGAVFVMAAEPVMKIYGFREVTAAPTMRLLILGAVVASAIYVFNAQLAATNQMWIAATLNCVWSVAFIGATWYWRDLGAVAYARANVLANLLHAGMAGITLLLLRRSTRSAT